MYKALLKRKIMLFFLIVAMVASNTFMFPIHSSATGNCVAVSSSVSAIDSDNQFKVTFHFSNNPGMMGYKMILSYDSSAINPLSVSQGKDFNVGQLTDNIGVKSGQFNVLWNHLSDFKGNGIAFEITFEKLADKYSEITVGYSQEDTFNEDWDDVILDCHNIPLNFAPAESSSPKLISTVSAVEYTNYFDVAFSLNNNTGLMGFKLVFKYDDSVLRPISVTRGSALTVGQLVDNIGVKDGEFNVLWNHLTNFTGNGQIFTIRFENSADMPTQIEVSYSQEDTFDENFENVILDCQKVFIPSANVLVTYDLKKISDISLGFGLIYIDRSSDNEMLIEDGFENNFSYLIPSTDNIDVLIKPNNHIGLCIKNISALKTVNMNQYLLQLKAKNMFDCSSWPIGDITNDNVIDVADISYLLLSKRYGTVYIDFDLNNDGWIDIADISVILSSMNYGKSGVAIDSSVLA